MKSLKGMEWQWFDIGRWLFVPTCTRHHIKTQHSTASDRLREVLLYALRLHPFPGWRMIIHALHGIEEDQLAAEIQEYAEPLTGMYDHQDINCYHILTLGAHVHEGYSTHFVYVCVCVSVARLLPSNRAHTTKWTYQHAFRQLICTFQSTQMALYTPCDLTVTIDHVEHGQRT